MTTTTFVALSVGEVQITDAAEVLFRQIPPHLWDEVNEQPSMNAFGPADADNGKPSFSRASVVTAQQARDWHNENATSTSVGVWAITVGEVDGVGLRAIDDSAAPLAPSAMRAPGHCYVDFQNLTKNTERIARGLLLAHALERREIATTAGE